MSTSDTDHLYPDHAPSRRHQGADASDPARPGDAGREEGREGRRPWEDRLEGESDLAWQAYNRWLRTAPALRSLRRTAREVGASLASAKRWSTLFRWSGPGRGQSFDAHRERELTRLTEALLTKAERDRTKAVVLGVAAIKLGVARIVKDLRKNPDARLKAVDTKFLEWALHELRLSRGAATEITEIKETGEALDAKVDEALDTLAKKLPAEDPRGEPVDGGWPEKLEDARLHGLTPPSS